MAGITQGTSTNAFRTALDAVLYQEYDYFTAGLAHATDPLLFMQKNVDKAAVITELPQGVGYFSERLEQQDAAEANPRIGNQKTATILGFTKSLPVTKWAMEDDQWNLIEESVADTGRKARLTQDRHALIRYADGFNTTTDTTSDAVALFSNSHVALDGQTVDNLETGVLTDANLETAIVSLRGQLQQDGTLGMFEPAWLLVPNALDKEGRVITQSVLRSGTANNDLNYYSEKYPGLQVKYSPFLDTNGVTNSTTAWFIGARNHKVMRYVRTPLNTKFVPWEYSSSLTAYYVCEYRERVSTASFDGVVGSNGTV